MLCVFYIFKLKKTETSTETSTETWLRSQPDRYDLAHVMFTCYVQGFHFTDRINDKNDLPYN